MTEPQNQSNKLVDETSLDLSTVQKILKWTALSLVAVIVLIGSYLALPILPGLPAFVIMGGPLGFLFFSALASLPILFFLGIATLLRKQKYWIVIILCLLVLGASGFYMGDFLQDRLEISASKFGIAVQDETPPGILNLPDAAIPKEYSLGRKGSIEKSRSTPAGYYLKEYYAHPRTGGVKDIIRLSYDDGECTSFSFSSNTREVTCKAGVCVVTEVIMPISRMEGGKWRTLNAYQFHYQINDNGSCAEVSFYVDDDTMLSSEQRQAVVDSLVRVPGERTQRSFEEKATPIIMRFKHILETQKKDIKLGLYEKVQINAPLSLTEGTCKSTLAVDVSPDEKNYVIHRPLCPNNGMSYCLENGQTEIITTPTELIQKTYHCQ